MQYKVVKFLFFSVLNTDKHSYNQYYERFYNNLNI